jgi:prevent-host-death family protein
MEIINIYEAKAKLSKLIEQALRGKEIVIAKNNKPLVKLEPLPEARPKRQIGTGKHIFISMSDDFDEPLEDFKEYME